MGTVGGGLQNSANGNYATVAGGYSNDANGAYGTVPGGYDNDASASYSFAAGRYARADETGCFMWGDSQSNTVACADEDTFNVRATGGIWFGKNSNPYVVS